MRRWCLALVLSAGCYRPAIEPACSVTCDFAGAAVCPGAQVCQDDGLCHLAGGGCGDQPDGPPGSDDVAHSDVPNANCLGKATGVGLFQYCPPTLSDDVITLPSFMNTAQTSCIVVLQSDPDVPSVCVLYARKFTVPAAGMRVEGPRPLVLVARETIGIDGVLDVASHVTGMPGAGANPSGCDPSTKAAASVGGGHGGGAGGAGQGVGGAGGSAGGDGVGATSHAVITPRVPRGGCSGDNGVAPNTCTPGRGGGAVYMIAGSSIILSGGGKINASGSGASTGGGSGCGGGGGGMIGFDTPFIINNGVVMAIGGGASSGANVTAQAGSDPSGPAIGGSGGGNNNGGAGGPGAGGTTLDGFAGAVVAGDKFGGGGGGAAGWIVVYGGGTLPYVMNNVGPPPSSPQ